MRILRVSPSRFATVTNRLRRDGFVLVLATFSVVLVGALIVATHSAVNLAHHSASSAIGRQRAFAAGEHALWSSVANWDPATAELRHGAAFVQVIHAAGDSAIITTVRLSDRLYWLVAEASAGGPRRLARRRTAVNVHVLTDSLGTRVTPLHRSWTELH